MIRHRPLVLTLLLLVLGGAGCHKAAPVAAPASDPLEAALPKAAQPKLQTMKLWLGAEEMSAELALTSEQQMTGMMFRTNMDENGGMLFPLPVTQRASFWMMHCPLPLSAAYIDPEGTIQEIHAFQANVTNAVTSATDNIRFVLETPQGWFDRHHITPGMVIRTERGPLMQTFFGDQ